MAQRILLVVAFAVLLSQAPLARAQLTLDEYKLFNQLLTERDLRPNIEKRLNLVGNAIERLRGPKQLANNTVPADLKRARIPAADAVPFLLKRLDHPSESVRRQLLRMLSAYAAEAKSAAPNVRTLLKNEPTRAVRGEAMKTLAKIEPENPESAALILELVLAGDTDDLTILEGLDALSPMAAVVPKSALPRIAKLYDRPSTQVAFYAFTLSGKVIALERPTMEELRTLTEIEWRTATDQGYALLTALADAGAQTDFATPLVLAMLESGPPAYLECMALEVLGRLRTGDPRAIAFLFDWMTKQDPFVRTKARASCRSVDLKQPTSVRAFAAGLRHTNSMVRLDVAVILRDWDQANRMPPAAHAEMLAPLIETIAELDDSASQAQLDAYLSLLRRFGPRAAPVAVNVAKLYRSDTFPKKYGPIMHGKLLAVLANVGVPESERKLVLDVLKKGPAQLRDGGHSYAAAARAAATFASPAEAVPLLLPGLAAEGKEIALYFIDWSGDGQGRPTTVRVEAIRALAKMGPEAEQALPLLKEIATAKVDGKNLDVLALIEARKAIQAITGKPSPTLHGFFADGTKESLNLDERLQVKLTLKLRNPRPQHILKLLQQATSLNFTMDENVDLETPVWSSTHSIQIPAFLIMRQLIAAPSVHATWLDVGDGYRLRGTKRPTDPNAPPVAKKTFPPFRDDSDDPLQDDPRLRKIVTLQLRQPTVHDILNLLQKETGVAFRVVNVDIVTPLHANLSWSNSPAWLALRNIAESPAVQGKWEKDEGGYCLRGTAPFPPPQLASPRPEVPPLEPMSGVPGTRYAIVLAIGFFATILLGALLTFALRMDRSRK